MENRPFPIPTGEAFLVRTPYLDKVGENLRKSELQRQQKQQADSNALDSEFSKNISGIRDADVNELVTKYGDYKNEWKKLNKGNAQISPMQQMDLLRKKADILTHIATSKKEKANEDAYAKDIMADKTGKYNDNATQFLIERRKLPINKMQVTVPNPLTGKISTLDMSNIDDNVKYQLGTTDFSKDFNTAVGQKSPIKIGESEPFNTPDGLQTQKKIYKGYEKTAPEVAVGFLQSVVGIKKTADLVKEHPELNDPNVLASIDSQYDQLVNSDVYKNAYKGKKLDFPEWMHDTPQGKVAMYLAKQYAINNVPKEELDKPQQNLGAVMKQRVADQKDLIGLRGVEARKNQANNDRLIRGRKEIDPSTIGNLADNIFTAVGQDITTSVGDKKRVILKEDVDPERWNILLGRNVSKKQVGIKPEIFSIPDGKGGYTKHEGLSQDAGTRDIKGDKGQTRSREAANEDYVNYVTPTKAKLELSSHASENTTGKVHTGYTRADLLNSGQGWTEDKINKAVKAGKLKLND